MKKIRLDIKIPVWYSTEIEVEDDEVVDFIWNKQNLSEEFSSINKMIAVNPETLSHIIDNFDFDNSNIVGDGQDYEPSEYWLKIGDNDTGRIFSVEEMNDMLESTETFQKLKRVEKAFKKVKSLNLKD